MNILCRVLAVFFILVLVGCETTGGGGGGASASSSSSGGMSDEQLMKIGIKETYDKRQ
jgi:phosphoribosylformylglycinamidine (FGAM) synthase-like enzyme